MKREKPRSLTQGRDWWFQEVEDGGRERQGKMDELVLFLKKNKLNKSFKKKKDMKHS